jgi:hypothetical protein
MIQLIRPDDPTQPAALNKLDRECDRCHASIDAHWQLCATCELRLATRCPGCDMPLPPAGCRQCGHCGRLLMGRWADEGMK